MAVNVSGTPITTTTLQGTRVNVFGTPITTKTLEGMQEYVGKTIRRIDRAHVALMRKNDEGKYAEVLEYVRELKKEYRDGVSTLCMIYNATGDPITFAYEHDWHGYVWDTPYPAEIANGQWGGFLHVKPPVIPTGSFGAIVYRGLNGVENVEVHSDWLAAWATPWTGPNKAFPETRPEGIMIQKTFGTTSMNIFRKVKSRRRKHL